MSNLLNLLKFTLIGNIWFSHLLAYPICHGVSPLLPIYHENLVPLWCVHDKGRSILVIFLDIYGMFWYSAEASQMLAFSSAVEMWNMEPCERRNVDNLYLLLSCIFYASSSMHNFVISGKSQLEKLGLHIMHVFQMLACFNQPHEDHVHWYYCWFPLEKSHLRKL